MMSLIRVFSIYGKACRYRLDLLLPKNAPLMAKVLFFPAKFRAKPDQSNGENLRQWFESCGPIFIKIGQLLSTRPDLLNEDVSLQLQNLQNKVAPFDAELSRKIIEDALGGTVETLFAEFDYQPLASASLAQVHGARLLNGDAVVVKVIRPNVSSIIERDLRLLKTVAKFINKLGADGRRLHAPEVIADYHSIIRNEINLRYEAANTQVLRDNFSDNPMNYTPKVHWEYLRDNVMVSERIDGIAVNDAAAITAQGIDLKTLAETGVQIFFTQVFDHNFFHADMHPGNIFVSKTEIETPQYISIDCAIVGSLTEREQFYLANMLLAIFRRNYRRAAEIKIQAGWVPTSANRQAMETEIRMVCEPIFNRPLSEISFASMLVELFKVARRFDMQMIPSLFLLQKTIINIEGLGRQLYPDLDLWQTAAPFLENWVRNRYAPQALFQKLPQLIEQMPDMGTLLLNVSQRLAEEPAAATGQLAEQVKQQAKILFRCRCLLLVLTLLVLAVTAWSSTGLSLPEFNVTSWHRAAIAVGTLISFVFLRRVLKLKNNHSN